MLINLIQHSIEWLNPESNLKKAENYIKQANDGDICIFSEMFSTGYCINPNEAAEKSKSTLEWMQTQAIKYKIAIAGSIATKEHENYYNRFYFVHPNGETEYYNKRHLFSFAGEDKNYTPGKDRVIINYQGIRILLLVCYDLRFPVWSRNKNDYDIILCVANWPKQRRAPWDILLKARAIENQAYVCGVNIVGKDPTCEYSGGTAAIDYLGNTIGEVADNTEGILSVTVNTAKLNDFRKKFPALNDADTFAIK